MKKITLLLVIIFTFLFSTTSWGEWSYVEEDVYNGYKFYYDKDRVRKNGKYLYFWFLIDSLKPLERGDFSLTRYLQLDCSISRYKSLKEITYKKSMGEGEMTSDFTPPNEWKYPEPESISEFVSNKVCKEHQ